MIKNKFSLNYLEFLSSATWRKQRLMAFQRWGRICQCCSDGGTLDVHHLNYHNLVDVTIDDLMPLCRRCHEKAHEPGMVSRTKNLKSYQKRKILISTLSTRKKPLRRRRKKNRIIKILAVQAPVVVKPSPCICDRPTAEMFYAMKRKASKLRMECVKWGFPPAGMSIEQMSSAVKRSRKRKKRETLARWNADAARLREYLRSKLG